jgi:hypothetical protein
VMGTTIAAPAGVRTSAMDRRRTTVGCCPMFQASRSRRARANTPVLT